MSDHRDPRPGILSSPVGELKAWAAPQPREELSQVGAAAARAAPALGKQRRRPRLEHLFHAAPIVVQFGSTSPISKLRAADDERRQAKRNSLADKLSCRRSSLPKPNCADRESTTRTARSRRSHDGTFRSNSSRRSTTVGRGGEELSFSRALSASEAFWCLRAADRVGRSRVGSLSPRSWRSGRGRCGKENLVRRLHPEKL